MHVFIDTSAFIALVLPSEQWHQKCVEKYRLYTKQHAVFATNILVLAELYTRLIYDFGKEACKQVALRINHLQEEGALRVFYIDPALFIETEKALLRFAEHKLSFTDASIYAGVKIYGLDEVFTLDQEFRKVGLSDSKII